MKSLKSLETLGRVRLSKHFFMRDFLYSEIGNFHAIPNMPSDVDLAVAAGARLCQELLDPLFETFGNVIIRSAFRSCDVNGFGNANNLNCASNEANFAAHIWDRRDADGNMGASTSIVVPWFADQFEQGRNWQDLAWWVHDHLPYSYMCFFPVRAALNLGWRENPKREISSYTKPKGKLLKAGQEPEESMEARQARYQDFPAFRGIHYPPIPAHWTQKDQGLDSS